MTIRYKIQLLFVALVSSIITLLGISVYYLFALERQESFRAHLRSRASYSAQLYALLGDSAYVRLSANGSGYLPRRTIAVYPPGRSPLYQFYDPERPADSADRKPLVLTPATMATLRRYGQAYFTSGDREAVAIRSGNVTIAVAAYDAEGLARQKELLQILLASIPISIVLTALAGSLFSRRLVRPLTTMIREVKDISSSSLAHRIDAGENKDELGQLADTFNQLLGRLEEAFEAQKRFISNASHELSTPLTSLSSQIQVALQRDRSEHQYRQVLSSVYEDVLQMRRLTRSLLDLAKANAGGVPDLANVRVDEVLLRIASDIGKQQRTYKVELYYGEIPDDKDCLVFGSHELLYSAFRNIIENGCKYSTDQTTAVHLDYSGGAIVVQVLSHGNPIKPDDYDKIFEPLYRGGDTVGREGFGLGLTLARSIIRLHKGSLDVASGAQQTVFTVKLPTV
jgi:signal transduction histidine kinase